MGLGPIPATRKVLQRARLSIKDVDLVELNEAFAVQVLQCVRELEIDEEKLNVDLQFAHTLKNLRSEEHTSELQSRQYLVCRLLLEMKKHNASMCSSNLLLLTP